MALPLMNQKKYLTKQPKENERCLLFSISGYLKPVIPKFSLNLSLLRSCLREGLVVL